MSYTLVNTFSSWTYTMGWPASTQWEEDPDQHEVALVAMIDPCPPMRSISSERVTLPSQRRTFLVKAR